MRSSLAADEPPGRVDCLINNLNDAVALGLFPILFSTHHLSLTQIGLPRCALPGLLGHCAAWYRGLSDRSRPLWLISTGIAGASRRPGTRGQRHQLGPWIVAVVLLGLGTATVYPTLLAAIGDIAHPIWPPERSVSTGSGAMPGWPPARCSRV